MKENLTGSRGQSAHVGIRYTTTRAAHRRGAWYLCTDDRVPQSPSWENNQGTEVWRASIPREKAGGTSRSRACSGQSEEQTASPVRYFMLPYKSVKQLFSGYGSKTFIFKYSGGGLEGIH